MLFDALLVVIGLVTGGTIVHVFQSQIDADVAKVVNAYNTELSKLKAAHTDKVVTAIKS